MFEDVEFGQQGVRNGNAFADVDPLVNQTLTIREAGSQNDLLSVTDVSIPADGIASIFVIGNVDATPAPLEALLCIDNDKPNNGLSRCTRMH
jgi:hypothetical protein